MISRFSKKQNLNPLQVGYTASDSSNYYMARPSGRTCRVVDIMYESFNGVDGRVAVPLTGQ